MDIVILFHGSLKINYIGYFFNQNASEFIQIQSDKLTIKGYRSAKLDSALLASLQNKNSSNIWKWRAKSSKENINYFVMFGVVPNLCTNFDEYPYNGLIYSYGISANANIV